MDSSAFPWETVTRSAGAKKWVSATAVADFGDSQSLWVRPGYPTLNALELGSCRLVNRSGSACTVGLGVRYGNTAWQAGQVAFGGAYTDDTSQAQDATTNDFMLYNSGATDGNGVLIGALERFNILGMILSTAGDQTTPVLLMEYWNGAGWTNLTSALIFADPLTGTTGEKVLMWNFPSDWARGGSGTGVPQTLYNIRLTFTVAAQGTIAPLARQVFVGECLLLADPVANGGQGELNQMTSTRYPKSGVALHPFFSVSSIANYCEVHLRTYG